MSRPVVEITADDIEGMLNNLRNQRTTYNAVDRASANGDQLTISFEGKADGNPKVNSANLVFYERASSPPDVYYYDPKADQSFAVATGATAEKVVGVLADGAAMISRIGSGGEVDLFHYKVSSGLVEVGADLGTTIQGQTKTFRGATSSTTGGPST